MPKKSMTKQLYMLVEHYKDAAALYRRFWDRGRMGPEGLEFVAAWFDENLECGYRLVKTHDRRQCCGILVMLHEHGLDGLYES